LSRGDVEQKHIDINVAAALTVSNFFDTVG
jgi:hypothetical protein